MKVLVVHNRYRDRGGEERAVELQMAALERAGVEAELLAADSQELGRAEAARSLLRGGEAIDTRGADVVHVHNMHPRFGPRALRSAREAGARVVLHLHNFRLFCAIATCFRDGEPCFRCHGRNTLPGLALRCRGSLPESAVYAAALARHQPAVLDAVDRFVTPSHFAAELLDPLPREVHTFFADSAAGRARGLAKAAVRRSLFRVSESAAERAFTLHYACACVPR